MSTHTLTLNVNETLTLSARQKVRTCLLFPDRIIGIKPIFPPAANSSLKITDTSFELKDMVKVECVGNCVFIEKDIKINAANMALYLYVIFAGTVQAIEIVNAREEAEEADIYILKSEAI